MHSSYSRAPQGFLDWCKARGSFNFLLLFADIWTHLRCSLFTRHYMAGLKNTLNLHPASGIQPWEDSYKVFIWLSHQAKHSLAACITCSGGIYCFCNLIAPILHRFSYHRLHSVWVMCRLSGWFLNFRTVRHLFHLQAMAEAMGIDPATNMWILAILSLITYCWIIAQSS